MSKLVYSGIYQDGAKIKTERDGTDIILTIRRKHGDEPLTFIIDTGQAIEMSYALIRAVKQINEEVDNE